MVRDHVFVRTTCGAVAPAPAAKRHERETKAKRMRPPGLNDQRSPLSRGPSGPPRSGMSGENGAPQMVRDHVFVRTNFQCAVAREPQ
jgi:hypothetical protein